MKNSHVLRDGTEKIIIAFAKENRKIVTIFMREYKFYHGKKNYDTANLLIY